MGDPISAYKLGGGTCCGGECSDCDPYVRIDEPDTEEDGWFPRPGDAVYDTIDEAKAGVEALFGPVSWWEDEPGRWMGEVA